MRRYDFDNSPGYWIFSAFKAIACAMNDELTAHGITYRQWEVLAWITHEGEMVQTELAEKLCIEAPTLVGVLDRMERDGWIQRVTDPADRRRKLIRPTDRVEAEWDRMVDCGHAIRARAVEGLSVEHLDLLREMLTSIRDNLQAESLSGNGRGR